MIFCEFIKVDSDPPYLLPCYFQFTMSDVDTNMFGDPGAGAKEVRENKI